MEKLKDNPNRAPPPNGKLVFIERVQRFIIDQYFPGSHTINPCDDIEERGFSTARFANNGRKFTSWGEAFQKSGLGGKSSKDVEETWTDYGLIMRAATGATYAVTGSARARAAYEFATARSNRISWAQAKGDPTFAIVPRALTETKPSR